MRRFLLITLAVAASLLSASANAQTQCPEHFAGGQPPEFSNQQLMSRAAEVCYLEFASLHSGLTKTPLWSAQYLTRERLIAAREIEREDYFFAEPALDEQDRAELSDYRGSGYDRGHLAPAADFSTAEAQAQSFSLVNIIPQTPENNRVLWRDIEALTRDLAIDRGSLYVLTGPLFLGQQVQALDGRVIIPTHVFKAIYDPNTNEAGAYVSTNTENPEWQRVSITTLNQSSGFDLFPDLPDEVKSTLMPLPAP